MRPPKPPIQSTQQEHYPQQAFRDWETVCKATARALTSVTKWAIEGEEHSPPQANQESDREPAAGAQDDNLEGISAVWRHQNIRQQKGGE